MIGQFIHSRVPAIPIGLADLSRSERNLVVTLAWDGLLGVSLLRLKEEGRENDEGRDNASLVDLEDLEGGKSWRMVSSYFGIWFGTPKRLAKLLPLSRCPAIPLGHVSIVIHPSMDRKLSDESVRDTARQFLATHGEIYSVF